MARYKITLSQSNWSGGTAAVWYDTDAEACFDAATDGNAVTSITVPSRASYTFLGFGLTNPYWRCIDESGSILLAKVKELFNTASTSVTGSLAAKTLAIYQAQTSSISGATATLRTITIAATYWKGAPAKIYYNPGVEKFYVDQNQTVELSAPLVAARECWTYAGCFYGAGPQYVTSTPAKSGDHYIDGGGNILDELRIRAKVQTTLTINPRGVYFSYKIVLDANGGSIGDGGVSAIYRPTGATGTYYTSWLCESGTEITALSAAQRPSRSGYVFGGFTVPKVTTASGAATATHYADGTGSLNVANLDALTFTPGSQSALVSKTVYARWVGVCAITVNKGTNGTNAELPLATFYADTVNGGFYADAELTAAISNIGVPTNECYRFAGCFDASAGSTQYVDASGDILPALAVAEYTTALTIYCRWAQVSWRLAFNKSSGADGTDAIYRSVATGDWYTDPLVEFGGGFVILAIDTPIRSGYVFLGYHKTTAATSDALVARGGALNLENLATLSPSGTTPPTATAYAVWQLLRTINIGLNATNATVGAMHTATATNGDNPIFYGVVDAAYYADANAEEEVGAADRPVVLPTVRCSTCTGIWGAASNGEQKFDDDGLLAPVVAAPTATNTTWYAQWTRKSYAIALDDNGGSGGSGMIFSNGDTAEFFADDDLSEGASMVTPPTRTGYTFAGYYSAKSGGTLVIGTDGGIELVSGTGARDVTVYAHWIANRYSLLFHGDVFPPKQVTFGAVIGALPTPTPASTHMRFVAWQIDGQDVSASTIWSWAEDKAATIRWQYAFGDVVDYFGLASANLVPFESDEGSNRPRVVTRHYGKAAGADQTGPVWRNPTVKYMVVGNMTLAVTLGRAFPKSMGTIYGPYVDRDGRWTFGDHHGMTESGYMITTATVETNTRQFPVVTVQAVANEGVDAINLFHVAIPLLARARAQNLLGAVVGGGELQTFGMTATCDPVVLTEGAEPCASDAVNGRFEAHAETLAYNFEAAPQAAAGFTAIGEPVVKSGTDYTRYRLTARKEIV